MPSPITLRPDDLEFVRHAARLWSAGRTQNQIGAELGFRYGSSVRVKLLRLGFDFERAGGLRVVTSGAREDFAEMDRAGLIVVAEEPAGAAR